MPTNNKKKGPRSSRPNYRGFGRPSQWFIDRYAAESAPADPSEGPGSRVPLTRPPYAAAPVAEGIVVLDDATAAGLRALAEDAGGASASRRSRDAATTATLHNAAALLSANAAAKGRKADSDGKPREATSYPLVFSRPEKQAALQAEIRALKAHHEGPLRDAGRQFVAGELSANGAAAVARAALQGLVDVLKALGEDVESANLEITYLENGNMEHVVAGIAAALPGGEIVMFVGNCPQGRQTLLMLFNSKDSNGKACPTCINLGAGLAAGSSADVEAVKAVAKDRNFQSLNATPLPMLDSDKTHMCPKLDGGPQDVCEEAQSPSLTGPGNSCVDYTLWVTKMLGLDNTVVALGNEAGRWAFGQHDFKRVAQSRYGVYGADQARPVLQPLVDTIIFESHPAAWLGMMGDVVFMRGFVAAMAYPAAIIFGTTVKEMEGRLKANLPEMLCFMKPGRNGNGNEGFSPETVKEWCSRGGLAGMRAYTNALGLDPDKKEDRHTAAVVLGIVGFRAVVARRGRDPNNPEDRHEVALEVMGHAREGRLMKQGVDPADGKAALAAMQGWAERAREGRLLKDGVDLGDPVAVHETMVGWAADTREKRLINKGVDLSDKKAVKESHAQHAATARAGRLRKEGVDPEDREAVVEAQRRQMAKARAVRLSNLAARKAAAEAEQAQKRRKVTSDGLQQCGNHAPPPLPTFSRPKKQRRREEKLQHGGEAAAGGAEGPPQAAEAERPKKKRKLTPKGSLEPRSGAPQHQVAFSGVSTGEIEPWVTYHAQRAPQPPPPVPDRAAYDTLFDDFFKRRELHTELQTILDRNRRDSDAFQALIDAAETPRQRTDALSKMKQFQALNRERVRSWEAAAQVLHTEVTEWKAALDAFDEVLVMEMRAALECLFEQNI